MLADGGTSSRAQRGDDRSPLPKKSRRRGHNEGTIVHRSDGRWAAAVTLPSGKRRWLYGKTRAEVAAKLNKALQDAAEDRSWGDARQIVEAYLRWWLEEQAKPTTRASTFRTYRMYVERHIIPAIGNVRLTRLSAQHVQTMLNQKQREGLAPRSVVKIRAILRRALGKAAKQGTVRFNAAQLADPPKVERYDVRPLTAAQVRMFLDGVRDERLSVLFALAVTTGLRQGEALGLRWEDIDLETGALSVRRQLQRIDGRPVLVELKTAAGRRALVLPAFVTAALREHHRRQLEERMAVADISQDHGLVFCRPDGTPLEGSRITHQLQAILKRLGLPHQRFHDLRHGAASLLRAQGADLKLISATLGHSQVAITADLYTHLFSEASADLAVRMDALLGPVRDRLGASADGQES
ncbi:MAG: tyrosine-type recombinase/integrase [Chloroflexi bacterium]|nr:tyrosine-type recombinase/integrase [Chloroflexota bacterium]